MARHPRRRRPPAAEGFPEVEQVRQGDRVGRLSPPRHCERSEAIQNLSAETVWIASRRSQ
ncbi:hypothetical protein FXB38_24405 [Bradyrhizobium cytisi]|uniref:Uncharacterized protein n=1 Tax=Bradyrhizobium cytisi TaxID=515489 RepID=A0A5S4WFH0_9BRAD|nr:hypothetical protein FXB38_24405 [Bradyrhizobium cytisi]